MEQTHSLIEQGRICPIAVHSPDTTETFQRMGIQFHVMLDAPVGYRGWTLPHGWRVVKSDTIWWDVLDQRGNPRASIRTGNNSVDPGLLAHCRYLFDTDWNAAHTRRVITVDDLATHTRTELATFAGRLPVNDLVIVIEQNYPHYRDPIAYWE